MSLGEYHRKRSFKKTPEPRGKLSRGQAGHSFVVQKHAASHLHYDFRLELDGVLKSWAVPKGPSLDPQVKSLAVEVEDHPLEYGGFEGTIPAGEYGGGTVLVWDCGAWESIGDPTEGYQAGRLQFRLDGEKLRGEWTLARMRRDGPRANWLLIKKNDDEAISGDGHGLTERETTSVLSGRTMEEIAAAGDRVWTSAGKQKVAQAKRSRETKPSANGRHRRAQATARMTKKAATEIDFAALDGSRPAELPNSFSPQLATLSPEAPAGDQWLHEMKFDGYRILAFRDGAKVRLCTRNGHDWTAKFPTVAAAVAELPLASFLLDGELVALDDKGISNFQLLQNAIKQRNNRALGYCVFDLPYAGGFDLRKVPLFERKRVLQALIDANLQTQSSLVRYSEHILGSGDKMFREACRNKLEGIVSKAAGSTYQCRRSRSWLKIKCHGRQEFVLGGYTEPSGERESLGALLIGYFDSDGDLRYAGRVGTGFADHTLRELKARFDKLEAKESPFVDPPRGVAVRGVTWLKPKLVAEIEFTEWTSDGLLRHPTFQGLREEKAATEVVREDPEDQPASSARRARSKKRQPSASTDAGSIVAGAKLTHPDRVLFADSQITKRDIAEYYEAIADWILPYVVDRPLTLVRCPDGSARKCFFQKHWTAGMPDAVRHVDVRTKHGQEKFVAIKDLAGLVSLVQMSALELHPWPARTDNLERPDQIVFDLDPDASVAWSEVCQAAVDLRRLFEEFELESFARVSGGKGLHVVIPLARHSTWDEIYGFARDVAAGLAAYDSQRFVANMRKQVRKHKIFVDYLRNQRGATSIASYSTRNRSGCTVAVPVTWDELARVAGPDQFTLRNVPRRLVQLKRDPWAGFLTTKQRLTSAMLAAAKDFAGGAE